MKSYGMTHIGQRRSINQDYIYFSDSSIGNLPNLYIVADGMGGHKAGDKASSFAVERFVKIITEITKEQPLCIMKDAIEKVNQELYLLAQSKEEYDGMGTTFVAASILDDQVYVMNIGDSRMYKMDVHLNQISLDHSLVEELVRGGQLTKEEARNHPQKNMITRALGVDEEVQPDFFQTECLKGERILLCSDGLSNMVDDETLEIIFSKNLEIETTARTMIDLANKNGGTDNIAVVIAENEKR